RLSPLSSSKAPASGQTRPFFAASRLENMPWSERAQWSLETCRLMHSLQECRVELWEMFKIDFQRGGQPVSKTTVQEEHETRRTETRRTVGFSFDFSSFVFSCCS